MKNKNIDSLEVKIKATISDMSKNKFEKDIQKLSKYLSSDVKYIIVVFFVQIGQSENNPVLNYKNKDDITLYIQPKIKNYIPFRNKDNAENYKQEELFRGDLYLFLEVKNGKIII